MAKGYVRPYTAQDGTKTWRARVDLGIDAATGRRRQKQRTFRTKKEAEAWVASIVSGVQGVAHQDRRVMTVGELLTDWVRTAELRRRPLTARSYETTARVHLVSHLGALPLQTLEARHLHGWVNAQLAAGVTPRTVHHALRYLRLACNHAVRLGLIASNPAALIRVDVPRTPHGLVWTRAEARLFLAGCHTSRYGPLWPLILGTGFRRGEALGLRWCDLDTARGRLTVAQTVEPRAGAGSEVSPITKSQAAYRTIPLAPDLLTRLQCHRGCWEHARAAAGAAWHSEYDLLFCRPDGSPLHPNTVPADFHATREAAGVPRLTIHDLRRTFITLSLEQGAPLPAVSKSVGHAKISITLDIYTRCTEAQQEATAQAIQQVLFDP